MSDKYKTVKCSCNTYNVSLTYNSSDEMPSKFQSKLASLIGKYEKINAEDYGLLAPLYYDKTKANYLYSFHPQGKVWIQSSTIGSERAIWNFAAQDMSCPDSPTDQLYVWSHNTDEGQWIYNKTDRILVKCID